MTAATERLTRLVSAPDRYDIAYADLLAVQVEAAAERLAQHRKSITLVANRAQSAGVATIGEPADLVPLLLTHTAYKSYPASWLSKGKWDLLAGWLDTTAAFRVRDIDARNVAGIDDWLERLAAKGHYVSCSSGTSGKVSMIYSAMSDRQINKQIMVASFKWATGLEANRDRRVFICSPPTNNFRFLDSWDALVGAFGQKGSEYQFPGSPMTVGRVAEMVALRKSIAEGLARPAEIASYEKLSAERQRDMEDAVRSLVEALIASRGQKLLVVGMYALLFQVAEGVRAAGYGAKDFHPDNALMVSGGLKGAPLPPDYHDRILDTFNINPAHVFHMYGMQELNTFMPRCQSGRFHVAPWLLLLPLDERGERLVTPADKEIEARAAFFDLSHDGRWGGVISGDRVNIDYGRCACGHQGPTIADRIVRYSDIPGGDKINCAGTIDAYVRGVA